MFSPCAGEVNRCTPDLRIETRPTTSRNECIGPQRQGAEGNGKNAENTRAAAGPKPALAAQSASTVSTPPRRRHRRQPLFFYYCSPLQIRNRDVRARAVPAGWFGAQLQGVARFEQDQAYISLFALKSGLFFAGPRPERTGTVSVMLMRDGDRLRIAVWGLCGTRRDFECCN